MVQLRSLFVDSGEFFCQCMQKPGGLLQWAAAWFTQLFHEAQTGVAAITAIWLLTFYLLKRAFQVSNALSPLLAIPVVCLLISDIDTGYWMYYLRNTEYFFRESLGILSVALLLNISSLLSLLPQNKTTKHLGALTALIAALCYPLIGYYSVVTLACLVLWHAARRLYSAAAAAAILSISPLVWKGQYTTIRPEEAFTVGMPQFESYGITADNLLYPIYIAIASLLLFSLLPLLSRWTLTGMKRILASLVLLIAIAGGSFYYMDKLNITDANYHAECKAYRAVDEMRWDDVLDIIDENTVDGTRELLIFKNIALFNKGEIGEKMYAHNDIGVLPNVSDSLHVSLAQLAGSIIFLQHGMTNFAYRWSMENSVEYGFSVADLKILTIASMINEEYELAEKYIDILSHTRYYHDWAEQQRALVKNPKLILKDKNYRRLREIRNGMADNINSDKGLSEKFILEEFSSNIYPQTPALMEMNMAYAMLTKDIKTFWKVFMIYAKTLNGKPMPIHYQEAAFLYGVLEPQTMNTQGMPFDKERIIDRYALFHQATQEYIKLNMNEQAIGQATEADYGDTFWWAYYFNRGKSYY